MGYGEAIFFYGCKIILPPDLHPYQALDGLFIVSDDEPVFSQDGLNLGEHGFDREGGHYLFFWKDSWEYGIEVDTKQMKLVEEAATQHTALWKRCLEALRMEFKEPTWNCLWSTCGYVNPPNERE